MPSRIESIRARAQRAARIEGRLSMASPSWSPASASARRLLCQKPMTTMSIWIRRGSVVLMCALLASQWACNSILGIEEVDSLSADEDLSDRQEERGSEELPPGL